MWWFIGISIVAFVLYRFFSDLNKDNQELSGTRLDKKFEFIVNELNDFAYNGLGSVTILDKRSFNLYQDRSNQIISFHYSTGILTITWRYKYFQKEVIHKKNFNDVRNLSIFEQQRIGQVMINEMVSVIERHKAEVERGIY